MISNDFIKSGIGVRKFGNVGYVTSDSASLVGVCKLTIPHNSQIPATSLIRVGSSKQNVNTTAVSTLHFNFVLEQTKKGNVTLRWLQSNRINCNFRCCSWRLSCSLSLIPAVKGSWIQFVEGSNIAEKSSIFFSVLLRLSSFWINKNSTFSADLREISQLVSAFIFLRWLNLTHFCIQVTSLHRWIKPGIKFIFLLGHRCHVSLRILKPYTGKQC